MKAAGRRLERLSKKTGLTVHALAFKDHVLAYKEALNKAKSSYYSSIISTGQGNPRALFSTISNIIKPSQPFPLTPSTDLCCEFLNYFNNKINTIYSQLQSLPSPTLNDSPSDTFSTIFLFLSR